VLPLTAEAFRYFLIEHGQDMLAALDTPVPGG